MVGDLQLVGRSSILALTKEVVAHEIMLSARLKVAGLLDIADHHVKVSLEAGDTSQLHPRIQVNGAVRCDRELLAQVVPEVGKWMVAELRWRLPGVEEIRG